MRFLNERGSIIRVEGPGYKIEGVPTAAEATSAFSGDTTHIDPQEEVLTITVRSLNEHAFTFPGGVVVDGVTEYTAIFPDVTTDSVIAHFDREAV